MKETKVSRARDYSAKALKPLIKAGRKTPSLYVKIAEGMSKDSGEPFHRQEVAAWLHREETTRTEPRLGTGILLLKVGAKLVDNLKKKEQKQKSKAKDKENKKMAHAAEIVAMDKDIH